MSLNTLKIIISGICLTSSSLWGIFETKRFDAKPSERLKYLNYMMPKELRFSEPALEVDRGNLLVLDKVQPVADKTELIVESNQSSSPSFPIVPYEESDFDDSIDINSPDPFIIEEDTGSILEQESLPLADPFQEMSNSSVNTTDDLLDVFEQSTNNSGKSSPGMMIPFIPPYSSMPDNLIMTNQSSYRRVQR